MPLSVRHDDADVRVGRRTPVELGQDAEEVRDEDAVDAAVADDEDRLPGALACEPANHAEHACEHVFERLAPWPGDEAVVGPVRQAARLVERRSGAIPDVDLPELAHDFYPEPLTTGDRLGCLACA